MTSIMDALNTSESSLQMIEQQTNLISNNIANASTPGYVQEELPQSAAVGVGAAYGVLAEPIQRMTDAAASATANQAAGSAAYSTEMVNVLTPYTTTLGQASDSTTLPAVLSAFSSALTTLSVTPSDATAQGAAATSAQTVATTLNGLDSAVSSARETADQGVGSGVAAVNSTLNQLAQNQTSLQLAAANGKSTAPFLDTQDRLIANMSSDLPVTVLQSGSNNVVVTTDQGTTLFDGTAHLLSFTATPNISSTTTATSLGAVTVNGQPIAMSQSGSIAADLQLRNVTLPGFSSQLDQIAGNLITAFQTADPTANAATSSTGTALAGLFVQSSGSTTALSSPTSVAGLAGTIAVNTAVSDNPALLQSGVNGTPSGSTRIR